ncbi:MAG: DUF2283 domain-containing protein [Pseudomonadota bacterium]
MYPEIQYDQENELAYIALSDRQIEKSIESEDELFVYDVDKDGELVGIEILSVERLRENFKRFFHKEMEPSFSPALIPTYIIPQLFHYNKSRIASLCD